MMDFSDLKQLLREDCGLKAGQIYEIKNYLATHPGENLYFHSDVDFNIFPKNSYGEHSKN